MFNRWRRIEYRSCCPGSAQHGLGIVDISGRPFDSGTHFVVAPTLICLGYQCRSVCSKRSMALLKLYPLLILHTALTTSFLSHGSSDNTSLFTSQVGDSHVSGRSEEKLKVARVPDSLEESLATTVKQALASGILRHPEMYPMGIIL